MSREDLQGMFTELANDISSVPPVSAVVGKAIQVRRRRRSVIGAALAVVVVSTASIVSWQLTGAPRTPEGSPSGSAVPTTIGSVHIDHLPARLIVDPKAAPYWPRFAALSATTPRLVDAPISHAVLLYSPPAGTSGKASPIYAYGDGLINGGSGNGVFRWVRVDVNLTDLRDGAGNRTTPLNQNSLGPMGRRAAFAQPDYVVIIDLQTGATDRISLPGSNQDVSWLIDGIHLLVSSHTQTWLVNVATRTAVPAAAPAAIVAALVGEGSKLTTLSLPPSGTEPPVLRTYDDGGVVEQTHSNVDMSSAAPYRISQLNPRGWRYRDLIAQAASGSNGSTDGDFVVVIDDRSATVTHILDLASGRRPGCCTVLGWSGPDDVVVHTDDSGVLDWRLSTGAVTRLTDRADGTISLGSTGCDWTIKIDGITATCIT